MTVVEQTFGINFDNTYVVLTRLKNRFRVALNFNVDIKFHTIGLSHLWQATKQFEIAKQYYQP